MHWIGVGGVNRPLTLLVSGAHWLRYDRRTAGIENVSARRLTDVPSLLTITDSNWTIVSVGSGAPHMSVRHRFDSIFWTVVTVVCSRLYLVIDRSSRNYVNLVWDLQATSENLLEQENYKLKRASCFVRFNHTVYSNSLYSVWISLGAHH